MKFHGYAAAFASLIAASAAHAQDASTAFQCELPYEETMKAMGSLEILEQKAVSPFPSLHGDGQLVEFAADDVTVFGAKPEALTFEFLEPHALQPKQKFVVTFSATFAKSASADDAIQQSVEWHIACGTLSFCIRSDDARPEGAGRLEYRRSDKLTLECVFEFTPEELDALGS